MTYPFEYENYAGSGIIINSIAGEALGNRKLVFLDTDSTWKLAKADNAIRMPVIGLTMQSATSGLRCVILLKGFIGLDTWTWTVGARIYASENTAGELTQTSPTNPDNFIQEIGVPTTSTQIFFNPRQVVGNAGATYTKTEDVAADELGIPVANNPTVVDQANLTLYAFTVNTDFMTYKLPRPSDYASGGLKLNVVWTNDGDTDDLNKNVRAQFDYQTASEGDSVDGSHANSPKNVNDTYTSASGWIEHHSDYVTIAEADFINEECIYVKVSFVTAPATALSCDPHLIGICLQYTAYAYT